VPDYLRDFREVVSRGSGSQLKRERLLKKIAKFERTCREVGANVNDYPQAKLIECLVEDGHGDFRDLMFQFCVARLVRDDFSDWSGWEYRNEWAMGSYSPEIPNRRWRLEPIESIAILGEQGIGDEIMFGSCIPDVMVRVPKVVYECDPRLVEPFKRSLRIDCKAREDITNRGDPVIRYLTRKRPEDAFIPVGDLPRLFRKSRHHFPGKPFLRPLPEMVDKWKGLRGRTGIAWRGRTGQLPAAELGVADPVCLQYDAWPYETEGLTVPGCDLREDVEDILGILANLERVITVPQTIVHFAGAVGCPVEVILPPVGSSRIEDQFRWRYIDPMPWYRDVSVKGSPPAHKEYWNGEVLYRSDSKAAD
jgi:hypothetical protein